MNSWRHTRSRRRKEKRRDHLVLSDEMGEEEKGDGEIKQSLKAEDKRLAQNCYGIFRWYC